MGQKQLGRGLPPNGVPLGLSGLSPGACLSHRLRARAVWINLVATGHYALEEVDSMIGKRIAGMRSSKGTGPTSAW